MLEPRPQPADDLHTCEAGRIAQRIRELIDAGTLIGAADDARPLRYGDILILLRTRTHASTYETALRNAGIPYLGAARGTLLDSLEVRDLEALLNTLIAPHNNLALAQVLRSPLFAARDEDLITLAQTTGTSWMERLLCVAPRTRAMHRWRVPHACYHCGKPGSGNCRYTIYWIASITKATSSNASKPLRQRY